MRLGGRTIGIITVLFVVWGCRSDDTPLQYGDGEYVSQNPDVVSATADVADSGPSVPDVPNSPWDVGGRATDSGALDTADGLPDVVSTGPDTVADAIVVADSGPDVVEVIEQGPVPDLRVATWNLRNFSDYGPNDYRIGAIAAKIKELSPDVIALQELRSQEGTDGTGDQAFDVLLSQLPEYDGTHVAWDPFDTSIGIMYRTDVVSLVSKKTIFPSDSWAFPRPPLVANLTAVRDGASIDFQVVVIHLKAYDDSADRRKEACEKLYAWLDVQPDSHHILMGDFNDDPHDVPKDNVFLGTFLGMEPHYYFVTDVFPPKTVTSIGWYHYVDGDYVKGQFIDHAIVQGDLMELYETVTPTIAGVLPNKFDDWGDEYSDHFPVYVDFLAPEQPEP